MRGSWRESWFVEGCQFLWAAMTTWRITRGLLMLLIPPGLFTLALIFGPPQSWSVGHRTWLGLTILVWAICCILGIIFAAGQHSLVIKRDFYAQNAQARADRLHRILGELLRQADRIGPDSLEAQQQWDRSIRAVLAEHCTDTRRDEYFLATRTILPDVAHQWAVGQDLPPGKFDAAKREVCLMLEHLEEGVHVYGRWLKP